MKVAYLILAHNQPEMLKELVSAINRPKEQLFVHIDRKADIAPFKELLEGQCTFIEQREHISWGSFSMIQATIHLLKTTASSGKFDYYSLLSGCDYPIKPVSAFESFLERNRPAEFITCDNAVGSSKIQRRYSGFFLFENRSNFIKKLNFAITKIQRIFFKRKPYRKEVVFYGSQWWTLTGTCVDYILDAIRQDVQRLKYFKRTHVPDEMFFQTLLMSSPFAANVENNNLRCILFEEERSNPKTWTMADKEFLLSSPAYFARKFDMSAEPQIIDFLRKHIQA